MSYIKTNWIDGDIITTNRLNNIEQGISNMKVVKTFETTLIEWQSSQCGIAKEYKYCIIRCN